ncbi:MAG: glucosamine kinase [Flavobacteriaceae bacterium]|jgi:glucosamine kinase
MFLVIESGSTKADWMLVREGAETSYSTKGFNPYFHTHEDILLELNDHLELDLVKDDVTEIFFYGAGCSSVELNAIIEKALSHFFRKAKVHVNHDLAAAAYACYQGEPQITCILGTGSNSCYFDGVTVSEEVPAMSYILGDEGSGSHFGKSILADYQYRRLPEPMNKELVNMGVTKASINENVYMKPNANVYIASFMPVLIRHKDLDYSQELIRKNFRQFIDIHVKCYKNYQDVKVNFIGSVASFLEKELKAVCAESNITMGSILRRPLDKLVAYHKNQKQMASNSLISSNSRILN